MVKTKRHFVTAPVENDASESLCSIDGETTDTSNYNSMIENGTSDDNDGTELQDKSKKYESDDGFSEREDLKPQRTPKKRKRGNATAKSIDESSSKKKIKTQETQLFKQPTVEEINELKETKNLFHSNLFRLQVKEMLTELKVKQKYTLFVTKWMDNFKEFIGSLESDKQKMDTDKLLWLNKCQIQVPFSLGDLKQKAFQFQFVKPKADPFLIGSAATQTLLGPKLVVDFCVEMPEECFQKDNYLNLIYDRKKSLYLTYLTLKLLNSKQFEGIKASDLKFNYFANNPLKPILEITPMSSSGSIAKNLQFRLFLSLNENTFKQNRFVPWNSNVRGSLFGDDLKGSNDSVPLATPNYNASVLFDMTMRGNQFLINEYLNAHKNLQEGVVLLKIWLRQRQLNVGFSGFQGYIVAMFVVYLVIQRKLHVNMSSYQVARNVWNFLAHSTWDEDNKGITLCTKIDSAPNQPTLEQFHAHYDVVFVDSTGFLNICANLSLDIYRQVRYESKRAVNMLNDMNLNSFQLIFMTKCPVYTHFDHFLKISNATVIGKILKEHGSISEKYNYAGNSYPQLLKIITGLLRKGLSNRILSMMPIEQPTLAWPVIAKAASVAENLHLGIVLNPERAFEILNKGPQANEDEANEFRSFWGEKAELRRFQDGSIIEACVWCSSGESMSKKRLIVRHIVEHLIKLHLNVQPTEYQYIAGELDVAYRLNRAFKTDRLHEKITIDQDIDAEVATLAVVKSFDDLGRKMRTIEGLPLDIISISGISPVFRYCDPVPHLPQARPIKDKLFANQVHKGIIQLGSSGKWPNEVSALRALKTAFYIKLAQSLRSKYKYCTKVTLDGVLILKDGFVFSIEIAHPKEVALLKKEVSDRGITQYLDSPVSIALQKRHVILPKVTSALHGLYQMCPSFGPSVMIAKRWLYSQLIDDGIWPDECTELLIAHQYLKTSAQQNPCQPQTGFLRFLHLLANTNWHSEMFLINFNGEMDDNEVSELENRFSTERDTFPLLFVATSYDLKHFGSIWSSNAVPSVNVLARVTILARHALSILEPAVVGPNQIVKPSQVFTTSSQGYDLVIHLKTDIVPNNMAQEFKSPFSPFTKPNFKLPLAGQNLIEQAVDKLRQSFSEFCAFFYNPCGGKEITVIWKPDIFLKKDFKVNDVSGYSPSDDGKHMQCNTEVLIEDFKVILKDFYLSIENVSKCK